MPEPATETIRCRYPTWTWWAVAFFGVAGCVCLALPFLSPRPHEPAVWGVAGFIAAFFLGFALWGGLSTARSEIVADAQGLSWRGIGKWRRARWDEVTDYHERLGEKSRRWSVVHTASGTLRFDSSYRRFQALREAIRQRATGARTGEWELEGTRLNEAWPLRFSIRKMDVILQGAAAAGALWMLAYFGWSLPPKLVEEWRISWQVALLALLLGGIVFGGLPLLWLWAFFGNVLPTWRNHRYEEILIRPEGFEIRWRGERTLTGQWSDVTLYRVAPWGFGARRVVETRFGSWEFTPLVDGYWVLQRLLERFIPVKAQAQPEDHQVLGGDAGRWTSGCRGLGRRVFHYRTATNRALLWMAALPAGMGALFFWLCSQDLLPQRNPAVFWGFLITGVPLYVWALWRYRAAGIELEDDALVQRTPFARKRLPFSQIRAYWKGEHDLYHVLGECTEVRFWVYIADLEELRAEIKRRAVNSQTREWDNHRPELLAPTASSSLNDASS